MTAIRRRSGFVAGLRARPDPPAQDEVLAEMRRVILDGGASPGTTVPVEPVAAWFGVSRIPVRESLKTLVGEGLVVHEARGDYRVATLTPAELREMYVVRRALEAAALRVSAARATATDDAGARSVHDRQADAVAAGDATRYHRESRLFHAALLAPAAMPRLLHMFWAAWNVTEPLRPMTLVDADVRSALHDDHGRMLAAFEDRDGERLAALSHEHYDRLEDAFAGLTDSGWAAERTVR